MLESNVEFNKQEKSSYFSKELACSAGKGDINLQSLDKGRRGDDFHLLIRSKK